MNDRMKIAELEARIERLETAQEKTVEALEDCADMINVASEAISKLLEVSEFNCKLIDNLENKMNAAIFMESIKDCPECNH